MYMYIHTHVHVHVHIQYLYMHIHVHVHVYITFVYVHVQCTCICMHVLNRTDDMKGDSLACCSCRVGRIRRQSCQCQAGSQHHQNTTAETFPAVQSCAPDPFLHTCTQDIHVLHVLDYWWYHGGWGCLSVWFLPPLLYTCSCVVLCCVVLCCLGCRLVCCSCTFIYIQSIIDGLYP